MINCHYNQIDEADFFQMVVDEKYGKYHGILAPICDRVIGAYTQYNEDFPALCARPSSVFDQDEVSQKEALQHCYSSATFTFKEFKANFNSYQPAALKTLCPYCMINTPDTLDHYVGQTEFPEYSILTKNLLPCCWKCNNKKREGWRSAGTRTYINFYDDQFLQHNFLFAEFVEVIGNVVPSIQFTLSQADEISDADFQIISSHFEGLGLLEKYDLKANSRLSTEIESIQNSIEDGITEVQIVNVLRRRYQSYSAKFGINHWEAIIYKLLADNIATVLEL